MSQLRSERLIVLAIIPRLQQPEQSQVIIVLLLVVCLSSKRFKSLLQWNSPQIYQVSLGSTIVMLILRSYANLKPVSI